MCVYIYIYIYIYRKSAQWVGSMDPHVPHEAFEPFDVREYFGSVPRSVLSTMQIMTQSHFASHIGRQVMMVYPIATLLFYVLVFGTSYGLMQGVIANIVQASMTSSATKEAANLELQRDRSSSERVVDYGGYEAPTGGLPCVR